MVARFCLGGPYEINIDSKMAGMAIAFSLHHHLHDDSDGPHSWSHCYRRLHKGDVPMKIYSLGAVARCLSVELDYVQP